MTDEDGFGPDAIAAEIDVSRETLERIGLVMETLNDWRAKLNLIGPKEWPHIWRRHVWDSAQLLPLINRDASVVDLGSGAGFPGLIIAAAVTVEGKGEVNLIESAGKKAAFLRAACAAADLRATVHNVRAETSPVAKADIVTARAFAPLARLMDYGSHWLENGAVGLLHKGESWEDELTAAQKSWTFAYEAIPSRSGGSGVILRVSEVQRVS